MKYIIPLTLLLFSCEDNLTENAESEEFSLLFIASEGNFGSSNGSIEVFKDKEKIQTVSNVGDVIQSILVSGLRETPTLFFRSFILFIESYKLSVASGCTVIISAPASA